MNTQPSCCAPEDGDNHDHGKQRFDFILWGSVSVMAATLILYFAGLAPHQLHHFAHAILEFLGTMWWGILLGILVVGFMNKVPREYFLVLLGHGESMNGIFRAALAGLLLDLCSHGIIMVGAKLYERGASTAQVMTFLIASPWNSLSLTIILFSLIGVKWTLVFIIVSAAIAILSGYIFMRLTKRGVLPSNPHQVDLPEGFSVVADAKARLKDFKLTPKWLAEVFHGGMHEARMLLRWLLLGIIIAAAIRAFVPTETFVTWFGPTVLGLAVTLIAATIMEVCSEGLAPVASDILLRAAAPGNAFAFLMAGVATDYTVIMVLREATKSWRIALFLPLVTVPQTVVLAYIMNHY